MKPDFACPKWGDPEHDWMECEECYAAYEQQTLVDFYDPAEKGDMLE